MRTVYSEHPVVQPAEAVNPVPVSFYFDGPLSAMTKTITGKSRLFAHRRYSRLTLSLEDPSPTGGRTAARIRVDGETVLHRGVPIEIAVGGDEADDEVESIPAPVYVPSLTPVQLEVVEFAGDAVSLYLVLEA